MAIFDYGIRAELCQTASPLEALHDGTRRSRQPSGYGRFARAADAIRFAIEEMPPELLQAAELKVSEESFNSEAIRRLYESDEYPLARRSVSG